jgi:hypothetical protein
MARAVREAGRSPWGRAEVRPGACLRFAAAALSMGFGWRRGIVTPSARLSWLRPRPRSMGVRSPRGVLTPPARLR